MVFRHKRNTFGSKFKSDNSVGNVDKCNCLVDLNNEQNVGSNMNTCSSSSLLIKHSCNIMTPRKFDNIKKTVHFEDSKPVKIKKVTKKPVLLNTLKIILNYFHYLLE